MDDRESLKVLSEIRDEIKEINAQVSWLTNKASEAIEKEESSVNETILAAELENKKSKKDLFGIILIICVIVGVVAFERLG